MLFLIIYSIFSLIYVPSFGTNCSLGISDIWNESMGNGTYTECQHLYAYYARLLAVGLIMLLVILILLVIPGLNAAVISMISLNISLAISGETREIASSARGFASSAKGFESSTIEQQEN
jgi:hypothetical protein